MRTEADAIRDALRHLAATHVVNATLPPSTIRRARVSRFVAVTGVAAIVVAAAFGGMSLMDLGRGSPTRIAPGAPSSSNEYAPKESAGGAPLLLVTEEGWRVTRADQYDAGTGEMTFKNGSQELELNWRPADTHASYVEDREHDAGETWDVTIAGRPALLIQYEGYNDFTALWLDGDKSLEMRGVFPTVEDYMAVAETLEFVDEERWLAAMPSDVVQPNERAEVVEEMLADIPVHPDVDVDELKKGSTVKDRYQLGALVTGSVACEWIEQWGDAEASGDEAAARESVDAMATSHDWAVLEEMAPQGGWSEVVWEYADAMAGDGNVSGGISAPIEESYRSGLGCTRGD